MEWTLVGWLVVVLRHIQRYFSFIVTGQLSSFQILACYRAPTPWAARGLKHAESTPTRAPGRPKTSFTSLPSEGPHAVRVSRESNPDRQIQSLARYLCATAAGWNEPKTLLESLTKIQVHAYLPAMSILRAQSNSTYPTYLLHRLTFESDWSNTKVVLNLYANFQWN